MVSSFADGLIYIFSKLATLYIGAVLLRFLLQTARADFYNPVCQTIVKISAPLLNPLRRVIPSWRRLDIASLVLALALSSLATIVMLVLENGPSSLKVILGLALLSKIISWALVGLIGLTLNIYFYGMVVQVVASFIAPFSGHPILLVIFQLLQPVYRVTHRILPPMSGLDFSPMLLMLAIKAAEFLVLIPLINGLSVNGKYVIGL